MWASSPGLAPNHLLLRICRRIPRCITTLLARLAPQLQEMNPRFADLIKRKTRIPSNTGFILPAVAQWSRFHALCRKSHFHEGSGKNSGDHKAEQQVMGREKGRFCAVLGLLFVPCTNPPNHGVISNSSSPPPSLGLDPRATRRLRRIEKGSRVRPEGDAAVLEAIVACTNYTPRVLEGSKEFAYPSYPRPTHLMPLSLHHPAGARS